MTTDSFVSALHPAMATRQSPEWPSARWVGALDLPAKLAPSIELVDSTGYRRARLLVRNRMRPVTFIEVDVAEGFIDGVNLSELVSRLAPARRPDIAALSSNDLPFITVVICTRNRTASLQEALASVLACDYPQFEVVVVDNASTDPSTAQYIGQLRDSRVRLVTEPMPGQSAARNAGILAARGDVVAYTDDDVAVDPMWLRWLGHTIQTVPGAGCVTGLVAGGEFRTPEQSWFEDQVNWSRHLTREEFQISRPPRGNKLFPFQVGLYGAGANFAMPRSVLLKLGGFDEAFGPGSPCAASDDNDMFVRVVAAGHVLIREPAAVVWHRHRADMASLTTQAEGYGLALGAWLTKVACDRSLSPMALRRLWTALRHLYRLTVRPSVIDFDKAAKLRRIQFQSFLRGPLAYSRSRRQGRRANPLKLEDASR